MNTVPALFMEDVFIVLGSWDLYCAKWLSAPWSRVAEATKTKIHVLMAFLHFESGKVLVTARQRCDLYETHLDCNVPLNSVDSKFITQFHVRDISFDFEESPSPWKEITLEQLKHLINAVRPTERTKPLRCDRYDTNRLYINMLLAEKDTWGLGRRLFSMRLPVDCVHLRTIEGYDKEIERFLETTGPLFRVSVDSVRFDLLFDKFVPIDRGVFLFRGEVNRHQLERLVMKCEMSGAEVRFEVDFYDFEGERSLENIFDFKKIYSKTRWEEDCLVAHREGSELELYAQYYDDVLDWCWNRIKSDC
ncbi:hypothetical protein QR680_018268 [Steinernema hermaphroditum]|uniref:Uncharacterized protein n=1 Tax=Steinernema hermaphroditum TaxID=289476 RepID=A0AA39HJR7_9BILA|nr:hypothetical protein QR680_018268 [Steinernema hermaphroditum]